jgi:pyrrolidone-carboxylate peptidase
MSRAVLARKSEAAPATEAKASSNASSGGLRIGPANDFFEQEADWAAEQVVSATTPRAAWSLSKVSLGPSVQRQCSCGGQCDDCEEKTLQRDALPGAAGMSTAPASVHNVLRGSGAPLDSGTRSFMESRFGYDFGRVRVHTDTQAAQSARSVEALAYTVGDHVVFGSGQFAPESIRGLRLLAHELAHTLQQQESGLTRRSIVRRAPAPGWTGSSGLNAAEKPVGAIRRIPIEGLKEGNQHEAGGSTESAKGRAIILLNTKFDPAKPADILFFFHGHNEGLRAGAFGNRDTDLYSLESQIEAAGKEQVIGILPQGTRDSSFGDLPAGTTPTTCNRNPLTKAFNTDSYLKEVFDTLKTLSIWTAPPSVGSVIISGHSGAGELINQGLLGGGAGSSLPQKLGTLKEVSLIDAINGPCEFVALQGWLESNLNKELADLAAKSEPDQLKYLKTSLRFRSYYEDSKKIDDYYKQWNVGPLPIARWRGLLANRKPLKEFLDKWFTDNAAKLPQSVQTNWKNNYVITYLGKVAHDDQKVNVINAPTPGGSTPVTESLNVLPKREAGAGLTPTAEVSRVADALRSPARPLAEKEKQWAERHFQHDFSQVRLHLNSQAAGSARSLQSLGFTVGEHIILDPRRYDPETSAGRRLLAHELTHVLQQGNPLPTSWKPSRLRIGRPEDRLERAADYHAEHPGPVMTDPLAGQLLQRAPAEGQLAKDVCETTAHPLKEQLGECNYARPENCPTYESWIETFTRLKTFEARATPSPANPPKGANIFTVLGGEAGSRLTDKPDEKALAKDPSGVPPPTTGLKLGETFIDHPTDTWVKSCLPDNLRATAYQLPADCADIAIILRHVWLSAHHRTQTLQVGNQTWVIGDESGGPGRKHALDAISDIGSGTVSSLVAPYSDAQGKPLLSFEQLAPLLHAGDILVWEHHNHGLTKPRTGGHTLTISSVQRDQAGNIVAMSFLQGNEPIFGERCLPGKKCDPAQDDKGKILKERHLPDTQENRERLEHAPGRRIEVNKEVVSANEVDYSSPDLDVPAAKKGDPPKKIWGWGEKTILLSAGPPKAANRPAMEKAPKGAAQETRISDWIKSFASAVSYDAWQASWESMLLEVRAFIEGGREVPEDQARRTGEAAGNKLWAFAKQPKGALGDESHFARLGGAKKIIDWLIMSRVPTSRDLSSNQDKLSAKLIRALVWIEESFELAARGASDIIFGATTPSMVKVLLTGFDPFDSSGSLAAPAKGTWNPSGGAILALDNQSLPVKSSRGKAGNANVQGVILPVNFEQFQAGGRGLVESIVSSKAPDLDAAITVSMDPNIGPSQPVRLERYAVGVHEIEKTQPSGATKPVIEPIPAAAQGTLGEGIIESNAPIDQIAAETEKKSKGSVNVSRPNIGEAITFRFATDAAAKAALDSLGGVRSERDITISDAAAIRQVTSTMVRQSNGTDITFQAKGRTFTAGVVSGPGGNFLSNEVSYRMLRLIKQQNLPQDPISFHVHTQGADPIPQDTSTPEARKDKADKSKAASGLLSRLVETLKRIIAATAKFILDRRATKKTP